MLARRTTLHQCAVSGADAALLCLSAVAVEKALSRAKRSELLQEACGYASMLNADKAPDTIKLFGASAI